MGERQRIALYLGVLGVSKANVDAVKGMQTRIERVVIWDFERNKVRIVLLTLRRWQLWPR